MGSDLGVEGEPIIQSVAPKGMSKKHVGWITPDMSRWTQCLPSCSSHKEPVLRKELDGMNARPGLPVSPVAEH